MSNYPRLSKAPIVLAIFEIKFQSVKNLKDKDYHPLIEKFKKEYPIVSKPTSFEVKNTPNTPLSFRMLPSAGFIFHSDATGNEFFLSNNTFTYRHIQPYKDWDDFIGKVLPLWNEAIKTVEPDLIHRVSVRYINSFEIPGGSIQSDNFFNSFIETKAFGSDEGATKSFLSFQMPINKDHFVSNVSIESKESINNVFPFIVDVDTLFMEPIRPNQLDEILPRLRNRKNEVFFNNLTAKSIELFK